MSDVSDLTTIILGKIQEDLAKLSTKFDQFREETRDRFDRLEHRVDLLTVRVDRLSADTKIQSDRVNARLDGVLEMFGRYHADHEERLRRLEEPGS
jgi:hypothetical protein